MERGLQAELSDIQVGDTLIAIDQVMTSTQQAHFSLTDLFLPLQYNVTGAPAKVSQRLLASLPFPVVLVFRTKANAFSQEHLVTKQRSLTYNLTVLYPPSLIGTFEVRFTDWTPDLSVSQKVGGAEEGACPIFQLRAPQDQFGCVVNASEYGLSLNSTAVILQRGHVDEDLEQQAPMLSLLLQQAYSQNIPISISSMAVVRRGGCTFVEKAKLISEHKAQVGLLVNSEDLLFDMPKGKENTVNCTSPFGAMSERGILLLHAAMRQEVLAIVSSPEGSSSSTATTGYALSTNCMRAKSLVNELLNHWAHSNPPIPISAILSSVSSSTAPPKLRSPTDGTPTYLAHTLLFVTTYSVNCRGRTAGSLWGERLGILRLPPCHVR